MIGYIAQKIAPKMIGAVSGETIDQSRANSRPPKAKLDVVAKNKVSGANEATLDDFLNGLGRLQSFGPFFGLMVLGRTVYRGFNWLINRGKEPEVSQRPQTIPLPVGK
jgi:hypothetical protein